MEEIWDSKEGFFEKLIFSLKIFFPSILSYFELSTIGPLCFTRPSRVSIERFNPLKLYIYSLIM